MLTTIYKDEKGAVAAVKLASDNPAEATQLAGFAKQFEKKPTPPAPVPLAPKPAVVAPPLPPPVPPTPPVPTEVRL